MQGVGKSCNFQPISRCSLLAVEDRWYILQCVWQALNSLSIHVTFTAIVPGAYSVPTGGQNVLKWRTFELTSWITWETVEDRWVHAAMCLTSIESYFHPSNFTVIVPGRPKCAETDARSVGDSHPSCYYMYLWQFCHYVIMQSVSKRKFVVAP